MHKIKMISTFVGALMKRGDYPLIIEDVVTTGSLKEKRGSGRSRETRLEL